MSEVKNEVEVIDVTPIKPEISLEAAQEAIKKDKEAREAEGKKRIEEVCKELNIVIDINYSLSEDKRGVSPYFVVVAL
jgi:uncharacterized pyridoxal phosphate-containing UPF0001 family protein